MPIIIRNVSNDLRKTGLHRYEVRINNQLICVFDHRREEPPSKCLMRAMEAVVVCEKTNKARQWVKKDG